MANKPRSMIDMIGSFQGNKKPSYDPRFDPSSPQNSQGAGISTHSDEDDDEGNQKSWFSKLKQLLGYTTPDDKGLGA